MGVSSTQLTGCRIRATDRAAASTSCESGDGAYGSFERLPERALDFLHTEVTCERTFQIQGCMASKMSNNTWLESLRQHSGHALTGCRVRATDRTAARTSCKNGDGADGSFKRPGTCIGFFFTVK